MNRNTYDVKVYTEKGMADSDCRALFVSESVVNMSEKERTAFFSDKDVVMAGYAGLAGSISLARLMQQELLERYPVYFVEAAMGGDGYPEKFPEAAPATLSDECGRFYLSEGGVLQGLWDLAAAAGVGLDIFYKKIPIRQETVEICNDMEYNPYQLLSTGSALLLSCNGGRTVQELTALGIPAAVIGTTNAGNDRVISGGEEKSFLVKRYKDPLTLYRKAKSRSDQHMLQKMQKQS